MASTRVLQAVCWGTVAFGAALLLMPSLTRAGFSLLIFGDPRVIDGWPEPARWYATFLHGVLGAVMVGWVVGFLVVLRQTVPSAWWVVASSVAAWYVPDTSYSLAVGAWQNAVLNTAFALLFVAGLWFARRAQRPPQRPLQSSEA